MKIFLTGSTGFLGKAITHFLVQHTYFKYHRGDDILKQLKNFKPDIIIHCAGEIYKEELMVASNILLTYSILEYVKKNNHVKMIYFGSSSEYGKKSEAMSELDCCDSQNLYAATKTAGSLLSLAYARSYNCDICVIRPFSVYGDYEPSHRLIPTLYDKITNNLHITLIKGTHDFIYILDFLDLVERVLKSPKNITQADIINVGTGICYTNVEVAETFAKILKKPVNYTLVNKFKECDSPWWVCDVTHAKLRYNFTTKFNLENGLNKYIIHRNEY